MTISDIHHFDHDSGAEKTPENNSLEVHDNIFGPEDVVRFIAQRQARANSLITQQIDFPI